MNGNGGFPENFAPGALPLPSPDNSYESGLQPEEKTMEPGSRNTTSSIDTKGTTGALQQGGKAWNDVNHAERQRKYRERQRERAAKQGQAYEETARLFEQISLENRQLKAEETALSQMLDYAREMSSLSSVSVGALREGWRLETDAMKDAILEAESRSWLHGERLSDEILRWEMR
jgi:multidrug efflux pump subunit AcrA (membrane-fusion protein)